MTRPGTPQRIDVERKAGTLVEMGVLAALDRAGLDVKQQGVRAAEDAADLVVESLMEAGLLVTPEVTAALEAAREWVTKGVRLLAQYPSYAPSDSATALIAAVAVLDASRG